MTSKKKTISSYLYARILFIAALAAAFLAGCRESGIAPDAVKPPPAQSALQNVTFDPNYTDAKPIAVPVKAGIIADDKLPAQPVYDDNYFLGWFKEKQEAVLGTKDAVPAGFTAFENTGLAGGDVFYALWRESEYLSGAPPVTFYWNDALGTSTEKKIRKDGTVALPNAVNGDKLLAGWYMSAEAGLDWMEDETAVPYAGFVNSNLQGAQDVYALWKNPKPPVFSVTQEMPLYLITKTPDYPGALNAGEFIEGQKISVKFKTEYAPLDINKVSAVPARGNIAGSIAQGAFSFVMPAENVSVRLDIKAPVFDSARKTYTFEEDGVFVPKEGETDAELLVVAGGGGGGYGGGIGGSRTNNYDYDPGAGGGGGGVYYSSSYTLIPGEAVLVFVGKGGPGGVWEGAYSGGLPPQQAGRVKGRGKNGGDSIFGDAGAGGGGGGANWYNDISHKQAGGNGNAAPASVLNGSGGHAGGNSGTAAPGSAGGAKRGDGTAGNAVSDGVQGSNPATSGGSGAGGKAPGTLQTNGGNGAAGYGGAGSGISGAQAAYSHGGKNGNSAQTIIGAPGNGGNGGTAGMDGSDGSNGIVILKVK
ncbi:MAG: hypothetical protein LBC77_05450 [Spirochaetaceae bacterium]|jgi:hypothetical protein|nr:hypothetical protein [Spirochaetaceae bacterium]